ncbi:MAG: hypothetical protein HQK58_02295 [Deltaproteobacteria bacterium]|nr:hypothetical protein [Deltaproteobacteria bacterium]
MSTHTSYVEGLLKLVRAGRPDPVKKIIKARLKGEQEDHFGLISPPLEREEYDESAVLFYIYNTLKSESEEDKGARDYLRQAVVELVTDALDDRDDLFYIDSLCRLVGYFQVRQNERLTYQLRCKMWGYLCAGLDRPLEEMMQLDDATLEYALIGLDLWGVAIYPQRESLDSQSHKIQDHHIREVISLFEKCAEYYTVHYLDAQRADDPRFHLMTLLFRTVLKLDPKYAGRNAFHKMCQLAWDSHQLTEDDETYLPAWTDLCSEYGMVFEQKPMWRESFIEGLKTCGVILGQVVSEWKLRNPDDLFRYSTQNMGVLDDAIGAAGPPDLNKGGSKLADTLARTTVAPDICKDIGKPGNATNKKKLLLDANRKSKIKFYQEAA